MIISLFTLSSASFCVLFPSAHMCAFYTQQQTRLPHFLARVCHCIIIVLQPPRFLPLSTYYMRTSVLTR